MVKRRSYKKWIWWGAGVVLVIAIVVGVVISINSQPERQDNKNRGEEAGKVEQKDGIGQDGKSEEEKRDEETGKQQTPIQHEGGDPNTAEELSGIITYTGINEGILTIRTSIDQYLIDGTCDLTLMQGGTIIYSDTTNIVGDVSTATCQGFDIGAAGLGGGNIEIIINLNADGKRGTIRGEANI
ncbi:hypothetical protein IKF21_01195 [Candidatus Saccharibacteria bacterium]|nr:hypothetical protein [Candidatus Saccharibacteria bacterium]